MRLFISYARSDIDIVNRINHILRDGGYDVWYDDHAIISGQNWSTQISDAIEDADIFVYILSPDSVESEYCQHEFMLAEKLRKPILPILVRSGTKLPYRLSVYQYIDLAEGITGSSIARLLRSIYLLTDPKQGQIADEYTNATFPRFFISYSRVDREFAERFAARLQRIFPSTSVWYDADIFGGASWWNEVLTEVKRCDIFFYLLSNESIESPYCQAEFREAQRLQKRVLPILVRPRTKLKLVGDIANIQYVDMARGIDDPQALAMLTASIQYQLERIVPLKPLNNNPVQYPSISDKNPRKGLWRSLGEPQAIIVAVLIGAIGVIVSALGSLPNLDSAGTTIVEAIVDIPRLFIGWSPILILVASTIIFTLIKRLRISFGLVVVFQIIVFLNLFSDVTPFQSYLETSGGLILGFLIGRLRIITWFINSFEFPRKYEALNDAGATASSLAKLLDTGDFFAPYKTTFIMQNLAKRGLTSSDFDYMVTNSRRRQEYLRISEKTANTKLKFVSDISELIALEGLRDDALDAQISLKRCVNKVKQTDSEIEGVRIYANWMKEQLRSHVAKDPSENLEVIYGMVWNTLQKGSVFYWQTYHPFLNISKDLQTLDSSKYNASDNIQLCNQIQSVTTNVADWVDFQNLPNDENEFGMLMKETAGFIENYSRSLNYPERERMLTTWISRLQPLSQQPITWETVSQTERIIVEHTNPWKILEKWLIRAIENLQKLDRDYLTSIIEQIGTLVGGINDIESLSKIDDRLEAYVAQEKTYGRMIDDTIRALISIGKDADAALASMPGSYSRQLALQDAHVKLNQLYNTLQTHHTDKSRQWCEALKKATILVDEYLKIVETSTQTGYRNPYIAGIPVQPSRAALFKGRMDLADQIVTKLRSGSRPTFVLHGPRRMGKTSFLLQLQNLLPGNFITTFCDMTKAGADQSDGSFFYYLAQSIFKQITRQPGGELLPEPTLLQFEKHPYDTFIPWLDEHVLPLIGNRVLFITVDEFELIGQAVSDGRLSSKAYENLRYIMQHYENISLMFAGVQNLSALGPNASSYFIGAHAIEISYLDENAAEELILNPDPDAGRMPEYHPDVLNRILHLTHRQPFLLQAICSEIIDIANRDDLSTIELPTMEEAVDKVYSTYSFYFQNVWETVDGDGKVILKRLVNGPCVLSEAEIGNQSISNLLERRIISKMSDKDYEIEIPLVNGWMAQQVKHL